MVKIGANAGIVGMTKEHLGLALALNVPVFVVVTKIDMCPPNVLEETLKMLNRMLRSQGCRKVPIMIKSVDDVVMGAKNMLCERYDIMISIFTFRGFSNIMSDSNTYVTDYAPYFNYLVLLVKI